MNDLHHVSVVVSDTARAFYRGPLWATLGLGSQWVGASSTGSRCRIQIRSRAGRAALFCRDPDGNGVEIIEHGDRGAPAADK